MVCTWFPGEPQKVLLLHSGNLPIWSKPEKSLGEIPFWAPWFQVFQAGIRGSWSQRENASCPALPESGQDNPSLNLASPGPGCEAAIGRDRYSYVNAVVTLHPFPVNCRLDALSFWVLWFFFNYQTATIIAVIVRKGNKINLCCSKEKQLRSWVKIQGGRCTLPCKVLSESLDVFPDCQGWSWMFTGHEMTASSTQPQSAHWTLRAENFFIGKPLLQ